MREPTDDELIAALLDVLPGEDWVRDPDWNAATMIRAAVEAPTRDAMLKEMGEDAFSDTVGRARLADELCRRFPQPITDAVLGECGFVALREPCGRIRALRGTCARNWVTRSPKSHGTPGATRNVSATRAACGNSSRGSVWSTGGGRGERWRSD